MRTALVVWLLLAGAAHASAQAEGHFSLMYDVLPDVDPATARQSVNEIRARLFAERKDDLGDRVRVTIGAYVDGLVADRGSPGARGAQTDAIVRPADIHADVVGSRFDLRVGLSRVVWGRLDEFQPTDVVNPIDLTRFLLEGRSEARLSAGLVRGRIFLPRSSTIEIILVPAFRASRFDQLDEATSPFNLVQSPVAIDRQEPDVGLSNVQGGTRVTSTLGRVDWGASVYRGFRTFPVIGVSSTGLRETFPRFTMIGGDFETVRGAWAVRGEVAAFVDDELQSTRAIRGVAGRSLEGGVGVDRRAGNYRVAANVLWSWRGVDGSDPQAALFAADEEVNDAGIALVVAADRSFARETRTLRVLSVYDPEDRTAFGRVIAAVTLRENTWLEGSAGIFAGSSSDTLGRLTHRDFLYVRLKVFF